MNLIFGRYSNNPLGDSELAQMAEQIGHTLAHKKLSAEMVKKACDLVVKHLAQAEYSDQLIAAGVSADELALWLEQIAGQLGSAHLTERLKRELPADTEFMPLGTLFHISAGNAYGLPAFSVLEGLLTRNINLIKLPGQGDAVSLLIFEWLIAAEPAIADYLCVFDFPSYDIEQLTALAKLADAVVVWGSDEAIKAVRALADPNIRLIEWGHKISFAYVDPMAITPEQMQELAEHICKTQQLYCSSCQGIYLDTDEFSVVKQFASDFSGILETAYLQCAKPELAPGVQAQLALKLRTRAIEAIQLPQLGQLYRSEHTSVWAGSDKRLEASFLFGNCWVKPLPKTDIVQTLRSYKNYLQTVSLYCLSDRRGEYSEMLFRAGVSRVTTAGKLDIIDLDIPHDGEYALRRYCRIITRE